MLSRIGISLWVTLGIGKFKQSTRYKMADLFFYFRVWTMMQLIWVQEKIRIMCFSNLSHRCEEWHWMRTRCTQAMILRQTFLIFQEEDSGGENTSGLSLYQYFSQNDLSPLQSVFQTRKTGLLSCLSPQSALGLDRSSHSLSLTSFTNLQWNH